VVGAALADRDDPAHPVAGVEHDHQHPLAAQPAELLPREQGQVAGAPHDLGCLAGAEAAPEPQGGEQRRRLGRPHPRVSRQLLRRGAGQGGQRAVLGEQRRGELDRALAAAPLAQHQRQQLDRAQRGGTLAPQALTRSLLLGQVEHPHGHGGTLGPPPDTGARLSTGSSEGL
jgi:hypothetical protein